MGVREYGELKQRMLTTTGAAVVGGCAIFAALSQDGGALHHLCAFTLVHATT